MNHKVVSGMEQRKKWETTPITLLDIQGYPTLTACFSPPSKPITVVTPGQPEQHCWSGDWVTNYNGKRVGLMRVETMDLQSLRGEAITILIIPHGDFS